MCPILKGTMYWTLTMDLLYYDEIIVILPIQKENNNFNNHSHH